MKTPGLDSITILAPRGTRKLLQELRESCGLTTEDVFSLGLRYIALKNAHDMKKSAAAAQSPSLTPLTKENA